MFDSFSKIGSSHKINEDYTLINKDKNNAILCDGCSSGIHTDVGVRLLAHLYSDYTNFSNIGNALGYAYSLITELGLNENSLYSTLGTITLDDNHIRVHLWGDGLVYIKYKDGLYNYFDVSFEKAPYYPIYDYFTNRPKGQTPRDYYIKQFGLPIVTVKYKEGFWDNEIYIPYQCSFILGDKLNEIDYILLFSDGIHSFQKNYIDIINELVQFKSLNGEFLRRRINYMFKKDWKDYSHADDFSVIGFSREN